MTYSEIDFSLIRSALATFDPSPSIQPNQSISLDEAFFPEGHRGVLDLRRQLVVGNRGMGKSFWTHALQNSDLRVKLAEAYGHPLLKDSEVVIGFNGSDKVSQTAPTVDQISTLLAKDTDPVLIWRAVLIKIAHKHDGYIVSLEDMIDKLRSNPNYYSEVLSATDDKFTCQNKNLLIVFDALDRLGRDWESIRKLTSALLSLSVGLQSFKSIRTKIFMRVDQFSDQDIFRFPDSSKVKNNHVDLIWSPSELYGLLLFELLRDKNSYEQIHRLAIRESPSSGNLFDWSHEDNQERLINIIAGEFMGSNKKRGRVYTWVPLHLSDAAQTCSPRTFLIAWKKAAEHQPAPAGRAVDHFGLQDGVRSASSSRLSELYEDYPWIKPALGALRRQFVPMEREELFNIWKNEKVIQIIQNDSLSEPRFTPIKFLAGADLSALLSSMRDVAVMEERSNGKINVPDIYRVEAEILRKGGVAVPKRRG